MADAYYEKWKSAARAAVQKQRGDVDKMIAHFGGQPWAAEHLTPQQQAEEFEAVADDPVFWKDWVQKTHELRGLSTGLVSRALVKENIEREAKRRGKTEAAKPPEPIDEYTSQEGTETDDGTY